MSKMHPLEPFNLKRKITTKYMEPRRFLNRESCFCFSIIQAIWTNYVVLTVKGFSFYLNKII